MLRGILCFLKTSSCTWKVIKKYYKEKRKHCIWINRRQLTKLSGWLTSLYIRHVELNENLQISQIILISNNSNNSSQTLSHSMQTLFQTSPFNWKAFLAVNLASFGSWLTLELSLLTNVKRRCSVWVSKNNEWVYPLFDPVCPALTLSRTKICPSQ